jgi:hypothetical protein
MVAWSYSHPDGKRRINSRPKKKKSGLVRVYVYCSFLEQMRLIAQDLSPSWQVHFGGAETRKLIQGQSPELILLMEERSLPSNHLVL